MHHYQYYTTAKIKMKPIKRKRKYIPKMKCVVEGCETLSRGNGVGKKGEYKLCPIALWGSKMKMQETVSYFVSGC